MCHPSNYHQTHLKRIMDNSESVLDSKNHIPIETIHLALVKMVCRKILVHKSCCPEENHNREAWIMFCMRSR